MKDINKVILIGRLGADPVQRETKNGTTVVYFPLATGRRVKSELEGEDKYSEETQWHRVVVWGKRGEACAQFLKKGQTAYVEGMVRSRKYDAKDGGARYSFEIHADDVSFLNSTFTSNTAKSPENSGEVIQESA